MLPDIAALEYFHFLRPGWALLLLPWLLMAYAQHRRRTRRDMFGGIIAPHLLEHLRLRNADTRRCNPRNVALVFMLLALLVLMGPTWRQQPSPLSQDDSALVIVLDVSASMEQDDIQPGRLQRAKQKVSDLLALRPDKKAALIAFSGSAHTVLSLTADQEILEQYLASIAPAIMPRPGKFPEYALPLVDEVLRQTRAPASIVMFTDGVGADSEAAFRTYFASRPHQLLVEGVGTEGLSADIVPLESAALEALADSSDGVYIPLTVDDRDVRELDRRIDSHYVVLDDSALPWMDSGYALVFPALALFLLWFRRGWTLTWACLLLPIVFGNTALPAQAADDTATTGDQRRSAARWFTDLWLTGDQQARLLMQIGKYPDAAQRFTDPMWKAMAYYYQEDFMLAAEYFSRSDSDAALFNEANARAHARDYVRAIDRYDRLLARNPGYPGAADNRARVQSIVDEINRLSESQQQEAGASGEDKALGSDDAIPAEGADDISWQQADIKQLTAEEILQDPATREMWLRGVQQDPASFLAIKFGMQLQRRETVSGQPQDLPR